MARKSIYNIILLLLLIVAVIYYIGLRREGFQDSKTIEIVIARYEEDISWAKIFPENFYSRMIIYNKGGEAQFDLPKSEVNTLPNYGRESHTYLSHVIDNYDNLGDITLFLPGSAWYRDDKQKRVKVILDYLRNTRDSVIVGHKDDTFIKEANSFSIDSWEVTNEANRKKNPDSKLKAAEQRPLGAWFEKRFPGESLSCVSFTGIMAVSREDILKRPLDFYKKMLEEHSHSNAEVVHYSERVWKNIFSIPDENCIVDEV